MLGVNRFLNPVFCLCVLVLVVLFFILFFKTTGNRKEKQSYTRS